MWHHQILREMLLVEIQNFKFSNKGDDLGFG